MFRASCRAGGICCRGLFGLDRLLDRLHEHLGRLECRNIVCRDLDSGVLGDIATGFLCTALDDEATETAEINVLSVFERILHLFHKSLDYSLYLGFFHAFRLRNVGYDICFCHFGYILGLMIDRFVIGGANI